MAKKTLLEQAADRLRRQSAHHEAAGDGTRLVVAYIDCGERVDVDVVVERGELRTYSPSQRAADHILSVVTGGRPAGGGRNARC